MLIIQYLDQAYLYTNIIWTYNLLESSRLLLEENNIPNFKFYRYRRMKFMVTLALKEIPLMNQLNIILAHHIQPQNHQPIK